MSEQRSEADITAVQVMAAAPTEFSCDRLAPVVVALTRQKRRLCRCLPPSQRPRPNIRFQSRLRDKLRYLADAHGRLPHPFCEQPGRCFGCSSNPSPCTTVGLRSAYDDRLWAVQLLCTVPLPRSESIVPQAWLPTCSTSLFCIPCIPLPACQVFAHPSHRDSDDP